MSATPATPAPLSGIRIADFTSVLAGPYSTYQLALLGADVVKIERPGTGDFSRGGGDLPDIPGLSAGYVAQNAAKRSITIDLKNPAGVELAHRLTERCDVVIENFSGGVADRLGIGYDAVRARNPRVVYCSLTGYGQDGPNSPRPAYDHVIQAFSGITMLIGEPAAVPNRIGPPLFDYLAGIYAAFAMLAALRERDRTGQPQRVDVAMLDAAIVAMASTTSAFLNKGVQPVANGNTAASGSPASGIFPTRDGLLSIAANEEHHVVRLCTMLGMPSLLEDPRFAAPDSRKTHAAAFGEALAQRLAAHDAAEWETILSAQHVPAVKVRTLPETLADPHVVARGVQQQVIDPVSGRPIAVPSIGFKWNGQAIGPKQPPSRLGGDTDTVLAELGLSAAEIAGLRQRRIV